MLQKQVEDKLQYFDENKYEICTGEVKLLENKKDGEVELKCKLDKETLVIQMPDKCVFPYLNERKNSRSCADAFLYVSEDDGDYSLHIMEYKKTVNTSTLKKSKIQFIMGIYNARAIAGFLNMPIKNIHIYSAYRNDGIIEHDSLIALRYSNMSRDDQKIISDWKQGICSLKVDLEDVIFKHNKVMLDSGGKGTCGLAV